MQVVHCLFYLLLDKDGRPYPQFEALVAMMENESELCLGHPVSVKYVNEKWRERGFKYNLFSIILNLIFHICLMIYTIKFIDEFDLSVCSKGSQGKLKQRCIMYNACVLLF